MSMKLHGVRDLSVLFLTKRLKLAIAVLLKILYSLCLIWICLLYTPSPISGRSGKTLLGQLMRIIIVTPPEPNVKIILRPQVIPGPSPTPTFHPSQPEITLRHNSIWVLRLPYVYVSEAGSHQPPKDSTQLSAWRALKMLTVSVDN